MRDGNILKRYVKPAARKLSLPFLNWQCLRRSHATWSIQAGMDPKSVQAQMRHADVGVTMRIYAQSVEEQQRRELGKLSRFAGAAVEKTGPTGPHLVQMVQ